MAKISSFRGYRFNSNEVGDLNKVVTQPYDKIDDKLQAEYMARSDYNLIRIIKNPPLPADTLNDNPYTRAAAVWEKWIDERVLIREPGPAIYPYYQEYTVEGKTYVRKGLIGLVCLDDEKSKVRAHEQTLSGPKADRLRLMRATEANDENIFMLYDDPEQQINAILDTELSFARPIVEVTDDFGAIHRLYRLTSPGIIHDITELFEGKELFIADGHHRYETAMNYMNECKSRNWKPVGAETFTYRMMTMVAMSDPGLVVLPTHRVLHSLENFNSQSFLAKAAENFTITEFSDRPGLYAALDAAADAGKPAFGYGAEDLTGYRLIALKNLSLMDSLVAEHSPAWKHLDVTVLHVALLEKLLGIDAAKLAAESNIHYIRGRDEALDHVGKDHVQAAFLINPTRVDQVREVAAGGERMPQKSTDFYPKLLSGMILMKMQIDKSMGLAVWEAPA
jgi:uncharacterized protein (DUF1015 family)